MHKRILCGDKQQPGVEDFGRDRGEGRVSGKKSGLFGGLWM